jgi:SAM-dependent methyltransferase
MSLSDEYRRQWAWRSWPSLFAAVPLHAGQTVLDLGCAVGGQAAELASRGARVIGIDANEDLLLEARSRRIPNAEFRREDLRALPDLGVVADGLWCSFAAAYIPDLSPVLASWRNHLRSGGWIALTEIDDLFGHQPLGEKTRSMLEGYARDSFVAGRYDFHMGRKLRDHLEPCGFTISKSLTVEDQELAFEGPARPEVVEAWRARFERMKLLRSFCGRDFEDVREDFLACLAREDHRSDATVCCCIATK